MAKVKPHRTSPSLDMTPMVDLAFLLVTFFMLTTKFAPEEPIAVDMPSSTAEIKLPDTDILTILIAKEGQVLFNVDNKFTRQKLIKSMGEKYGVNFTNEQIETFASLNTFGLPIGNLPQYLDASPDDRKALPQIGIPTDSLRNELQDWIIYTRVANPKVRIAIKGDSKANYPVVKRIINTLQDNNISRFNLITNLEVSK